MGQAVSTPILLSYSSLCLSPALVLPDKRIVSSASLLRGHILDIRMSRSALVIPVRVALGICGNPLFRSKSLSSEAGRLRKRHLLLGVCFGDPRSGVFAAFATKNERKAETETMMTAMLHSCCIQKASQTISTLPSVRYTPEILTILTIIMTSDRQSERPRPIFCRTLMRTFHSKASGNDRTMRSVTMSMTVVMLVSRMTLWLASGPSHARYHE